MTSDIQLKIVVRFGVVDHRFQATVVLRSKSSALHSKKLKYCDEKTKPLNNKEFKVSVVSEETVKFKQK
jgi:hypothetical protein